MTTKPEITRIIAKYALVLIVLYLLQFIIDFSINEFVAADEITPQKTMLRFLNPLSILILNLVAALIVRSDIRKYKISAAYIVLLTLIFKPVGVCLFLISLILQTRNEEMLPADEKTLT